MVCVQLANTSQNMTSQSEHRSKPKLTISSTCKSEIQGRHCHRNQTRHGNRKTKIGIKLCIEINMRYTYHLHPTNRFFSCDKCTTGLYYENMARSCYDELVRGAHPSNPYDNLLRRNTTTTRSKCENPIREAHMNTKSIILTTFFTLEA